VPVTVVAANAVDVAVAPAAVAGGIALFAGQLAIWLCQGHASCATLNLSYQVRLMCRHAAAADDDDDAAAALSL
jgi:hypothetical protein